VASLGSRSTVLPLGELAMTIQCTCGWWVVIYPDKKEATCRNCGVTWKR